MADSDNFETRVLNKLDSLLEYNTKTALTLQATEFRLIAIEAAQAELQKVDIAQSEALDALAPVGEIVANLRKWIILAASAGAAGVVLAGGYYLLKASKL